MSSAGGTGGSSGGTGDANSGFGAAQGVGTEGPGSTSTTGSFGFGNFGFGNPGAVGANAAANNAATAAAVGGYGNSSDAPGGDNSGGQTSVAVGGPTGPDGGITGNSVAGVNAPGGPGAVGGSQGGRGGGGGGSGGSSGGGSGGGGPGGAAGGVGGGGHGGLGPAPFGGLAGLGWGGNSGVSALDTLAQIFSHLYGVGDSLFGPDPSLSQGEVAALKAKFGAPADAPFGNLGVPQGLGTSPTAPPADLSPNPGLGTAPANFGNLGPTLGGQAPSSGTTMGYPSLTHFGQLAPGYPTGSAPFGSGANVGQGFGQQGTPAPSGTGTATAPGTTLSPGMTALAQAIHDMVRSGPTGMTAPSGYPAPGFPGVSPFGLTNVNNDPSQPTMHFSNEDSTTPDQISFPPGWNPEMQQRPFNQPEVLPDDVISQLLQTIMGLTGGTPALSNLAQSQGGVA